MRRSRVIPAWQTSTSPHPAADLAEVTRIYGIRHWIEQGYKQVKDDLGWADFQVRSDIAIRRHQALVNCAFSFCWATSGSLITRRSTTMQYRSRSPLAESGGPPATTTAPLPSWPQAVRSVRAWPSPVDRIAVLVGSMVQGAPQLQALISSVAAGCGLYLYIPN